LLTKYLDAGKEVASHLVLLPHGLRYSEKTTRRDWTEQLLAEIRSFYAQYTETGAGMALNLQGIKFDTVDGGIIPLAKYLEVLLEERAGGAKAGGQRSGLSEKYLSTLRQELNAKEPNILLDPIRARLRMAKPGDGAAIAREIA